MKKCGTCKLKECPEECFNSHPGSMIALKKLIKKTGEKFHIVGP